MKQQLADISRIIDMYHDKKDDALNKMSYLRGMQLYVATLRKTYQELEDIYYLYALKPQIRLTQPIVLSCVLCIYKMITENELSRSPLL